MKRKICVVTGSRAEYGLLRPLIKEIKKDNALRLCLIATGMHLCPAYGLTYKEILKDDFKIDEKIDIALGLDTAIGISRSMGIAIDKFARAYNRLRPDIVTVLGDRFEIFSAVSAALIAGIPVGHIGGGELTEGSFDDSMRHAITKMSHLHFTCTEEYRKRVVQLGEDPAKVFTTGSLGVDNIKTLKLLSEKELEKMFGFRFGLRNLLVTFHPATLEAIPAARQFKELLVALDTLKDTEIFFTNANADTGGRAINNMVHSYVKKNPGKAVSFVSMGHRNYLSMLRFVDGVVGNSSSGIVEAPSFKIGTVNIGDRQRGRVRCPSIIDCEPKKSDILKAIKRMYSKGFKRQLKHAVNLYAGKGNAAVRIKDILKKYDLQGILKKEFYNKGF